LRPDRRLLLLENHDVSFASSSVMGVDKSTKDNDLECRFFLGSPTADAEMGT
jgi:hypothetical protein